MNITPIDNNYRNKNCSNNTVFKGHARISPETVDKTPYKDTYYSSRTIRRPRPYPAWKKVMLFLSGAAACAGTMNATNTVKTYVDKKPKTIIIEADPETDYEEMFGVSDETICEYNGIRKISEGMEIIIPREFDNVGSQVENLKKRLTKRSLSSEEKSEILEELEKLSQVQSAQNQMAECYTDGKFVYWAMIEDAAAEDLKKAYGIKDGALKDYNTLNYNWETEEESGGMYGTYKDYTHSILKKGETYKVPLNKVMSSYRIEN